MAQHLFTATYPVPGQWVNSANYGASFWAFVFPSIFSVVALVVLEELHNDPSLSSRIKTGWLVCALLWLLAVVVCCKSVHLEITPDAISYSSFWRKPRTMRFSEIGSAMMIDYNQTVLHRDPGRTTRKWTLMLTPKDSARPPVKIPLTWVDWKAHDEIIRLLQPTEWSSATDSSI